MFLPFAAYAGAEDVYVLGSCRMKGSGAGFGSGASSVDIVDNYELFCICRKAGDGKGVGQIVKALLGI